MITAGTNASFGFQKKKQHTKTSKPKNAEQNDALELLCLNKRPIIVGKNINNREKAPINKSTISGIKKLNPIAIKVRKIADSLENFSSLLLSESSLEKFDFGKHIFVAKIETLLINVSAELKTAAKKAPITNPRIIGLLKTANNVFNDANLPSSNPRALA